MSKILDFNKLLEINKLLKEHNLDYTIHGTPGCASCGVELKGSGTVVASEEICLLINEYLKDKWMQVEPIAEGSYYLNVN